MDKKIGKVLAIVLTVAMVFGSLNLTTAVFAEEHIEALAEESKDDATEEEGIAVLAEENIDDAAEEEGIAVLAEETPMESTEEQNTGTEITVANAADLEAAVQSVTSATVITLTGTPTIDENQVVFNLEKTLSIPSGVSITIKGAAGTEYCIKATQVSEQKAVIYISEGSTLNLENVIVDANQLGRVVYNAGTLNVENSRLENGKIEATAATYGVGIYNTGTVTLNKDAVVQNNAINTKTKKNAGTGIYNTGAVTLNDNAVVQNNTATNTATSTTNANTGVGIYNTGTLTMNGSSAVQNNSCDKIVKGVGICNSDGTVTLNDNAVVQNNSSSYSGTAYGAGIYSAGTLIMNGSSAVQSNSCVGKTVQGVGIYNAGTLEMDTNTAVKENTYQPVAGAAATGSGIGIFNVSGASSNLILAGSVCDNQAIDEIDQGVTVQGVGIYHNSPNNASSFTMANGSITGNTATGDFASGSVQGVGCYLGSTKTYLYGGTISNNSFSGETADTMLGAGVYASTSFTIGGNLQITSNNTDNLYLADEANITVGQEMEKGSRIDYTYGGALTTSPKTLVTLNKEDEQEYFQYTSDVDESKYSMSLAMNGNEQPCIQIVSTDVTPGTTETVSDQTELEDALKDAGNDRNNPTIIQLTNDIEIDSPLNVGLDRQVQITSVAGENGQENYTIYISEGSERMASMLTINGFLTLSHVTLDAKETAQHVVYVYKGADVNIDEGATITGGSLQNSKEVGAGLYIAIGASATLKEGGSITGNIANGVYSQGQNEGIGVYNAGTFKMTGGSITDNTVTDQAIGSGNTGISGGALYNDGATIAADNPAKFEITGGTISGNTVTCYGGAIFNSAPTENTIENVTIKDNQAVVYSEITGTRIYKGTNGGAIYTSAGTIEISHDTKIEGNSAINGGGIFITGSNTDKYGTVIMDADTATITGNATITGTGYGAGVFVDSGKFTLLAGTISGNQILDSEESESDESESDESELEWYQGLGGGIFVNGNRSHDATGTIDSNVRVNPATLELFGGEVTGNTAVNGGSGIYVSNIAYQYTSMREQETYTYGAALVNVKGSPMVTGNTDDDIRLASAKLIDADDGANVPKVQTLTVVSGGLEDAKLNVSKEVCTYKNDLEKPVEDNIFVVAGDGYLLTDTDVNAISCKVLNDDLYQIMKEDADGETGYNSIYASKVDLSSFTVTLGQDTYTYTGSKIEPTVSVMFGNEPLDTGDYALEYEDNTNVGTAKVKITINKESFTGAITKEFQITPKVLVDSTDGGPSPLTLGAEPITYNGQEQLPSITVKDGETELVEGTDYEVSCEDCITAGEKTLTVTGIGNYEGTSLTGTFTIEKASIEKATVSGIKDAVYTGSAITYELTVKDADGNTFENTDYTVGYDHNINAGTATVTITGKGNYTGTLTKTFTIAKANQAITGVNKSYTQTYSKNGMTLKAAAKTTVSYSSKKKSVATVDSKTGKITYVGAGTTLITITAAATSNYNRATTTVTLTVNRAKQTITAKVPKTTYKVSKLKKRKATFNIGAKSSGNGTLKYTVSKYPKKAKKFISITKKGKVTMKKKAPKGTYKITVTAGQTKQYNKATKTVTVRVK